MSRWKSRPGASVVSVSVWRGAGQAGRQEVSKASRQGGRKAKEVHISLSAACLCLCEPRASLTPSLHCSMKATTMSCTGRAAGYACDNLKTSVAGKTLVILLLLLGVNHPRELLAHHQTVVPACNSSAQNDNQSSDSWMMEKTSGRMISVALAHQVVA